MSKKIIIAGGGTGGHIFPAIAIAGALRKLTPDVELLFVGAKGKMEMEKVPQAGYRIEGIDISGLNRSSLIKNIGLPVKLIKSFFQVRHIIQDFMPDAVVGVGGYSSYPVLRAAQSKGIPTFIHESNSFAGKANQWLGKKATAIFVASEGMEKFFPAQKIKITGNPVRANLTHDKISRKEGIEFFGLDPAKLTLLCTGGSLGAKGINEAIAAHLDAFEQNGFQLIWQTGKPFAQQAAALCKGRPNIWTRDFITQMEYAFPAGDTVISRSGAMSIAELCVQRRAVVFVPFPFAAEDHQTANARTLVNKEAGLMIKDSEAMDKLVETAITLLKDEPRRRQLEENIGKLAVINADEVIAKEILAKI
jgi:UDP-N-acetylglucosamine--N-acetylmuramyl-(pentapeptide) pyrophosphoryl-undecaprenol N-acetylglucosamine transferase